jgi:hypothetical protein
MIFKRTNLCVQVLILFSFLSCTDTVRKESYPIILELDTISFAELSRKSYDYLNEQQNILDSIYRVGSYQNWYYDQLTGELTFSDSGITKLIIKYEEVGSLSFKTNTWLWSWRNPYLEDRIKSEIAIVKNYGLKRGFEKLTEPKWKADEYDAWEMTAIAAYIMKAKGAYRVPSKDNKLLSFMIFKNITWANSK